MSETVAPLGVDRPSQAWDWMHQTAQTPNSYDWVRPEVADAWGRCVEQYSLHTGVDLGPATDLSDDSERSVRPWSLGMQTTLSVHTYNLYSLLHDPDVTVLLTDPQCRLMHMVGSGSRIFSDTASLLKLGVCWSESIIGNNGVGTACVLGEPAAFLAKEHYYHRLHRSATAGCPVKGPCGEVLAILGLLSTPRDSVNSMLAILRMAGALVEADVFKRHRPEGRLVRMWAADAREALKVEQTGHDGLVVIGDGGRVVAANSSALGLLGLDAPEQIIGEPLDYALGLGFPSLVRAAAKAGDPLDIVSAVGTRLQVEASGALPEAGGKKSGAIRSVRAQGKTLRRTPVSAAARGIGFEEDAIVDSLLRRMIRLLERKIPVLVVGESGVGKEHLVQLAHRLGPRKDHPLVAINCAAIPRDLIESELFGYEAGSFTGASREGKPGKFVQASNGTLFLDEIGDMKLDFQSTLLRVLETSEVVPVGGVKPIKVDVQVIAATNVSLRDAVARNTFRRDLYYRLNGAQLWIPSLRERPDKIQLINTIFEQEMTTADPGGQGKVLSNEVVEIFMTHPWPGNIRQLRNVLKTTVFMSKGAVINEDDLPQDFLDERNRSLNLDDVTAVVVSASEARRFGAEQATTASHHNVAKKGRTEDAPGAKAPPTALKDWEHQAILRALEECDWNVTNAARRLGITRSTVYQKIAKHGIRKPKRSW